MNIKELNKLLIDWGKFWASKETLQGYASTSPTERHCEVLRTGVWISSDKHLFSHHSEQIYVPSWIWQIDKCLPTLEDPHRSAINRRYIKNVRLNRTEQIALLNAQVQILSVY